LKNDPKALCPDSVIQKEKFLTCTFQSSKK
jgi:hypothetical protein